MELDNLFNYYERKFLLCIADMPDRNPADIKDKQQIINIAKQCLGIKKRWIPSIEYSLVDKTISDGYTIDHHTFVSWENVAGSANLYIPAQSSSPLPFILLCCGHGHGCKLNPAYHTMAAILAKNGMAVLVPDNIGQGERVPMGHTNAAAPFACGISLQGLIIMEHIAHIKAAYNNPRFDSSRIGAIGNSGGGMATCFLSALCPELVAIASSGFPSSFEYIARKEKKHCCCTIVPGILGQIEMWQLYGCFAPKPLLIFQGLHDELFPQDIFNSTSRKIRTVYEDFSVIANFRSTLTQGTHSWDEQRIELTNKWFSTQFGTNFDSSSNIKIEAPPNKTNLKPYPPNAIDTAKLALKLTGKKVKHNILQDEFIEVPNYLTDKDQRIMFANFELFLKPNS